METSKRNNTIGIGANRSYKQLWKWTASFTILVLACVFVRHWLSLSPAAAVSCPEAKRVPASHPEAQRVPASRRQYESRPNCRGELTDAGGWTTPDLPAHLSSLPQEDDKLMEHICEEWLLPPSTKPRVLDNPEKIHYSQRFQSELVDAILQGRRGGFFVEVGAATGENLSNSLFFEKSRDWSGLLMEGYAPFVPKLLSKRRHAYVVPACISSEPNAMVVDFWNIGIGGGITDAMEKVHINRFGGVGRMNSTSVKMQCLPLFSVLRAIGVNHIDYFSLDVEGAELPVLKSIPFDKITIDVFSIEYVVGKTSRNHESQKKLREIIQFLTKEHDYEIAMISPSEDITLRRKDLY